MTFSQNQPISIHFSARYLHKCKIIQYKFGRITKTNAAIWWNKTICVLSFAIQMRVREWHNKPYVLVTWPRSALLPLDDPRMNRGCLKPYRFDWMLPLVSSVVWRKAAFNSCQHVNISIVYFIFSIRLSCSPHSSFRFIRSFCVFLFFK